MIELTLPVFIVHVFSSEKDMLAEGFMSYVEPPMDAKSIVIVSLVGTYCLFVCVCVCMYP